MLAPIATEDPERILGAGAAWQDWTPPPRHEPELHDAVAFRARQLRALDRYERRALSARKRAIRTLDASPHRDPTAPEPGVSE